MAFAALVLVACDNKDNPKKDKKDKDEDEYVAPIKIDGDFADWAKLDAAKVASATCDANANHTALKLVKVYADKMYVYVYFEWDTDQTEFIPDVDHTPFHMYINADGDATTGGYGDQWSDACTDILLEGGLYDSNGLSSWDPSGFLWTGEANGSGWSWEPDGESILSGGDTPGLFAGAGVEGKYEISITREIFPIRIADNFSIGFDIQKDWETVGLLPNGAVTEENPAGTVPSLQVKTDK